MVANYRCNELKEEAIAKVKGDIEVLLEQSDKSVIEQFGERCNTVMTGAGNYYKEVAKQYNKDVFAKVYKELQE